MAALVDLSESECRCFETVRLPFEKARSTSTDVAKRILHEHEVNNNEVNDQLTWGTDKIQRHAREPITALIHPVLDWVPGVIGFDGILA